MDFRPFVGNGNGNTFLVVSQAFCHSHSDTLLLELWRLLEVDSLLILAPSPLGDVCMLVPGADGIWGRASGEFCGNGSSLVARFFHETTGRDPVIVSRGGERFPAHVSGDAIRVKFPHPVIEGDIVLAGGEPHQSTSHCMTRSALVRFCNDRAARVSANQVRLRSFRRLELRTFEHSINRFTACCGTGAVSMAYLYHHTGLLDSASTVVCPGGSLQIEILRNDVIMTGAAEIDYQLEL